MNEFSQLIISLSFIFLTGGLVFLLKCVANLRKCIEAHETRFVVLQTSILDLESHAIDLETRWANSQVKSRANKPVAKAPAKPKVTKKPTAAERAAFEAERQRILTTKDFYDDDEPTP